MEGAAPWWDLAQYGALGIAVLAEGAAIVYLARKLSAANEKIAEQYEARIKDAKAATRALLEHGERFSGYARADDE